MTDRDEASSGHGRVDRQEEEEEGDDQASLTKKRILDNLLYPSIGDTIDRQPQGEGNVKLRS